MYQELIAELTRLKEQAAKQGCHDAADVIEAAITNIHKLPNRGGVTYVVTKLNSSEWMCEYLINGERNRSYNGTHGTGYKIFNSSYGAKRSGQRYVSNADPMKHKR